MKYNSKKSQLDMATVLAILAIQTAFAQDGRTTRIDWHNLGSTSALIGTPSGVTGLSVPPLLIPAGILIGVGLTLLGSDLVSKVTSPAITELSGTFVEVRDDVSRESETLARTPEIASPERQAMAGQFTQNLEGLSAMERTQIFGEILIRALARTENLDHTPTSEEWREMATSVVPTELQTEENLAMIVGIMAIERI